VDPFSLLLLAQTAVSAIKSGCDMLREGQAVINDLKGEAEGVVGQINEAKEAALGLWESISGLFDWAKSLWASVTGAPAPAPKIEVPAEIAVPAQPVAKKKKQREPEPDADILQMQVVHEVSQQLGKFFDIQQKIQTHYKNLEDESLHVYDANQNHAMKAIERVEVELQLEEMTVKIRETMVYAPRELKDLYTRFLQMYSLIKEEQEFARQLQIRTAKNKRARAWQRRNFRIEMAMWAAAIAYVIAVAWGMMLSISSTACCSSPSSVSFAYPSLQSF
jgi:hypothetical protein